MAPLVKELEADASFSVSTCVTAQHREMLDSVLELFSISPQHDLNLMSHGQTITDITTRVLQGVGKILAAEKPDLLLVHGDTTTTFAGALAGYYEQIPVGHVEAGLRSGSIYSPFPEEMNRILTDAIATIHFAPTEGNRDNLLRCGIDKDRIHVTGNTVIDALLMIVRQNRPFSHPLLQEFMQNLACREGQLLLLTSHRRENWGISMQNIFSAVRIILDNNPRTHLVFPVHPNPLVGESARSILGEHRRALLVPPLDYAEFAGLMARSHLILTDSGGIQEEGPALGKPVIVLRKETERPEAVEAGTVRVAGVDREDITRIVQELLDNENQYNQMARAINPYGDGLASSRIITALKNWFDPKNT